jgi:hypothetical protein
LGPGELDPQRDGTSFNLADKMKSVLPGAVSRVAIAPDKRDHDMGLAACEARNLTASVRGRSMSTLSRS